MNLSQDERQMLEGDKGEAVQRAMELLVRIGEGQGAEGMVDIGSVEKVITGEPCIWKGGGSQL